MPKETVIEVDAVRVLMNEVKPRHVEWTGKQQVKITLDFDKDVLKVFDENPLIFAKVREAISETYYKWKDDAAGALKDLDNAIKDNVGDAAKIERAIDAFERDLKRLTGKLEGDADAAAVKAWAAIKKEHKEYAKYSIKCIVDAVLGIGGLVMSILGLGGAVATGGLSAFIGITGLVKSITGLMSQFERAVSDAETVQKKIETDLDDLRSEYAGLKRAGIGLAEVGKAAVKTLFGAEFTTIETVGGNLDLYANKLRGINKASEKMAAELNKLLKEVDTGQRQAASILSNNPRLARPVEQLEKMIDNLIKQIISDQERIAKGITWAEGASTSLDSIAQGKPGWAKLCEKAFIFYDLAFAISNFEKSAQGIVDLSMTVASTAKEIEGELEALMK